jgi:hypothetical protein
MRHAAQSASDISGNRERTGRKTAFVDFDRLPVCWRRAGIGGRHERSRPTQVTASGTDSDAIRARSPSDSKAKSIAPTQAPTRRPRSEGRRSSGAASADATHRSSVVLSTGCVRKADTRRSWNAAAAIPPCVFRPCVRVVRASSDVSCGRRMQREAPPRRTVSRRIRAQTAFPAAASAADDQHN